MVQELRSRRPGAKEILWTVRIGGDASLSGLWLANPASNGFAATAGANRDRLRWQRRRGTRVIERWQLSVCFRLVDRLRFPRGSILKISAQSSPTTGAALAKLSPAWTALSRDIMATARWFSLVILRCEATQSAPFKPASHWWRSPPPTNEKLSARR